MAEWDWPRIVILLSVAICLRCGTEFQLEGRAFHGPLKLEMTDQVTTSSPARRSCIECGQGTDCDRKSISGIGWISKRRSLCVSLNCGQR